MMRLHMNVSASNLGVARKKMEMWKKKMMTESIADDSRSALVPAQVMIWFASSRGVER